MSINPYKGLFPYGPEDERLFFGRDKETSDLIEMIKNNQLVVIYGDSGTGKTSLIHAKLFPELKRQYYFPIYIRLNYLSTDSPLTQLRASISKSMQEWDKSVPEFTADQSLIEYAAKTNIFNGLVKPILFFDQFEELFTLAPLHVKRELIDELTTEIADLVELRLPNFTQKGNDDLNIQQKLTEQECTENILKYSVVLSLREDFIGQLDDLRLKMPSLSNNRYRLKKFTRDQALEAILLEKKGEPASDAAPTFNGAVDIATAEIIITQLQSVDAKLSTIKPGALQTILSQNNLLQGLLRFFQKKMTHEKPEPGRIINRDELGIDPTILSLYCYQLYEGAKLFEGVKKIEKGQVANLSTEEVINNYYLKNLPDKKMRYAIENYLITADGRRVLMLLTDFVNFTNLSLIDIETTRKKTATFRIYGEGEDREIELAHDRLAKRAFINKKIREANAIKRNALITVTVLLALFVAATASILYNIKEKEKKTNYITVKMQLDSLHAKYNRLETERKGLLKNYNALLSSRNVILTDRKEINSKIYELQNSIRQLTYENGENARKAMFWNNIAAERKAYIEDLWDQDKTQKLRNESDVAALKSENTTLKTENATLKNRAANQANNTKTPSNQSTEQRAQVQPYSSSGSFSVNHFLPFQDVKILLLAIDKDKNTISVQVCNIQTDAACDHPIISTQITGAEPATFTYNNFNYTIKLTEIKNVLFTPTAVITFAKNSSK